MNNTKLISNQTKQKLEDWIASTFNETQTYIESLKRTNPLDGFYILKYEIKWAQETRFCSQYARYFCFYTLDNINTYLHSGNFNWCVTCVCDFIEQIYREFEVHLFDVQIKPKSSDRSFAFSLSNHLQYTADLKKNFRINLKEELATTL